MRPPATPTVHAFLRCLMAASSPACCSDSGIACPLAGPPWNHNVIATAMANTESMRYMRFPSSIRTVAKSFRYRHCGWGWSGQSDIPSSPIWQLASCADKHSDDTEKLLTDKTQTADAGCRSRNGRAIHGVGPHGEIVEERIMSDDKVGEPDRS